MKAFSALHPVVSFIYFAAVLLVTMLSMNPVILVLSAVGAVLFLVLSTAHGVSFRLYFLFFVIVALSNPIFVHSGATPLFFVNGNAVTLEAVLYGIAAAAMLCSVMLWCRGLSEVFTSDKILYLFGRLSPVIAVIISMSMRFVPDFRRQLKKIHAAQKTLGLYSGESVTDRVSGALRVISALVTWAIENAVETSQSMTARGFALHGKTSFSLFRFRTEDGVFLTLAVVFSAAAIVGMTAFTPKTEFYPLFSGIDFSPVSILTYTLAAAFFLLPSALEAKEALQWSLLKSKI